MTRRTGEEDGRREGKKADVCARGWMRADAPVWILWLVWSFAAPAWDARAALAARTACAWPETAAAPAHGLTMHEHSVCGNGAALGMRFAESVTMDDGAELQLSHIPRSSATARSIREVRPPGVGCYRVQEAQELPCGSGPLTASGGGQQSCCSESWPRLVAWPGGPLDFQRRPKKSSQNPNAVR